MSIDSFVRYGLHRRHLETKQSAIYGPIEIYDIGETNCVGATYPDGARQAQPVTWQSREMPTLLAASLKKEAAVPRPKPKLTRTDTTNRPRLTPTVKRPRLAARGRHG